MAKSFGSHTVTKSELNGFLVGFYVVWMVAGVSICGLSLGDKFAKEERPVLLMSGLIPILITALKLWGNAWKVLIDRVARTITFRNLVSNKEVVYSFDELDGFVQVYVPQMDGEKTKVVYLVKDRKFLEKLSGSFYSNLDELEDALASLKFLGVQKLSLTKRIAIFRKRPVL